MDEEQYREWLRKARLRMSQAAGQPDSAAVSAKVDAKIAELTQNKYANLAALEAAFPDAPPEPTMEQQEDAALARTVQRRGGAVGDFARAATDAATFGFTDELYGGLKGLATLLPGGRPASEHAEAYREGRDASRQRQADQQLLTGGGYALAQIAGSVPSLLVGAAPAASAAMKGNVLSAMGRGAAAGGLLGAAEGAGRGDTWGERAMGAGIGGVAGGLLGGVLPGAGAVLKRGTEAVLPGALRTRPQVAQRLGELAGVPGGRIKSFVDQAVAIKQMTREQYFKPLEQKFATVADPEITSALKDDWVLAKAYRQVIGRKVPDAPSFRQLQSTRQKLVGLRNKAQREGDTADVEKYGDAADRLTTLMESKIPGFAEANTAYRASAAEVAAFQQGARGALNARPEQIQEYLAKLPTDAARLNFRKGLSAAMYDRLAKGGELSRENISMLKSLEGEGWSQRLREMFTNDDAYSKFMETLLRTNRGVADRRRMVTAAKYGVVSGLSLGAGAVLF